MSNDIRMDDEGFAAMDAYAKEHGEGWQERLTQAWLNDWREQWGTLRAVRNTPRYAGDKGLVGIFELYEREKKRRAETKTAPEEWHKSRDAVPEGYVQVTIYGEDGRRVATVFDREAVNQIGAVPKMLAALEEVIRCRDALAFRPELVRQISEAITEAKGE